MTFCMGVLLKGSYGKAKLPWISLKHEWSARVKVDGWKDVQKALDEATGAGGMLSSPGQVGAGQKLA